MNSVLKSYYIGNVIPEFIRRNKFINIMAVPKIKKVVLNVGVGKSIMNKKLLLQAVTDLTLIAGQKAVITKARKSNASFKIREGWEIGCMVTLRRKKMYNFLDKLLFLVLPCVRDFRGLCLNSFDGFGNYTIGIKEHIVFPEINRTKIDFLFGLNITIVTTAKNNFFGLELLSLLKFPFQVN